MANTPYDEKTPSRRPGTMKSRLLAASDAGGISRLSTTAATPEDGSAPAPAAIQMAGAAKRLKWKNCLMRGAGRLKWPSRRPVAFVNQSISQFFPDEYQSEIHKPLVWVERVRHEKFYPLSNDHWAVLALNPYVYTDKNDDLQTCWLPPRSLKTIDLARHNTARS